MTRKLREEIDGLVLEHDTEALGTLLCLYEFEDDIRELLYAAIDVASDCPLLDVDEVCVLS